MTFRPGVVEDLPDGREGPHRAGGLVVEVDRRRGERATAVELACEQIGPRAGVQLAVGRILTEAVVEGREHVVMLGRVLAHVHRREVEPEGRDEPDEPGQRPVRDQLTPVRAQRGVHLTQLVQELVGVGVLLGAGGTLLDDALPGAGQPLVDVGTLEPVGLLAVEVLEAVVDPGQPRPVVVEGGPQVVGHAGHADGGGQLAGE